ncbi:MAG: glucose-6-phosphate dehydrogenase [Actinomycetota bacterium]|nr:glucose-6-phosphate dehydrogenase [Actinomycetota bacterium]
MPDDLVPADHVITIFGARGDLARRSLLPALWRLDREGLLPREFRVIGNSLEDLSTDDFRALARRAVEEFSPGDIPDDAWSEFSGKLAYTSGQFKPGDTDPMAKAIRAAEAEVGGTPRRLFYFAVPPSAYASLTAAIGEAGLKDRARVVYEKPFGGDLEATCRLNAEVHGVLDESQVYRIDHFLGKETVQNTLALRFANGMFEPVWDGRHIDHVQIDIPETLGIGTRAGFYESIGAMKDMIVTHLFQVLTFVAMEPPARLAADDLMAEKTKVMSCLQPLGRDDVVRGQYAGYRDEPGVAPDSQTETFFAARVAIDNWRWSGVPFFLRTGKRLAGNQWTVTLAFKQPPNTMFGDLPGDFGYDHLALELAPTEGISLGFLAKRPGPAFSLARASMNFAYEGSFGSKLIGAYERLIHDALIGDRTLFTSAETLEAAWQALEGITKNPPPVEPYEQGSWGPGKAENLIAPRRWRKAPT